MGQASTFRKFQLDGSSIPYTHIWILGHFLKVQELSICFKKCIYKKLWLLKIPTPVPHVLSQLELSADLTTRTYPDCHSPPCSLVSQPQRQIGYHLLPFVYYYSSYGWVKKKGTTSCAQIWKGRWQNIMRSTSSLASESPSLCLTSKWNMSVFKEYSWSPHYEPNHPHLHYAHK